MIPSLGYSSVYLNISFLLSQFLLYPYPGSLPTVGGVRVAGTWEEAPTIAPRRKDNGPLLAQLSPSTKQRQLTRGLPGARMAAGSPGTPGSREGNQQHFCFLGGGGSVPVCIRKQRCADHFLPSPLGGCQGLKSGALAWAPTACICQRSSIVDSCEEHFRCACC